MPTNNPFGCGPSPCKWTCRETPPEPFPCDWCQPGTIPQVLTVWLPAIEDKGFPVGNCTAGACASQGERSYDLPMIGDCTWELGFQFECTDVLTVGVTLRSWIDSQFWYVTRFDELGRGDRFEFYYGGLQMDCRQTHSAAPDPLSGGGRCGRVNDTDPAIINYVPPALMRRGKPVVSKGRRPGS